MLLLLWRYAQNRRTCLVDFRYRVRIPIPKIGSRSLRLLMFNEIVVEFNSQRYVSFKASRHDLTKHHPSLRPSCFGRRAMGVGEPGASGAVLSPPWDRLALGVERWASGSVGRSWGCLVPSLGPSCFGRRALGVGEPGMVVGRAGLSCPLPGTVLLWA